MNCVVCQAENKEGAKNCRKCGVDMNLPPMWTPTWKWHARVVGIVYVALIGAYFAISAFLNYLPEPYQLRQVPPEITPWIK